MCQNNYVLGIIKKKINYSFVNNFHYIFVVHTKLLHIADIMLEHNRTA